MKIYGNDGKEYKTVAEATKADSKWAEEKQKEQTIKEERKNKLTADVETAKKNYIDACKEYNTAVENLSQAQYATKKAYAKRCETYNVLAQANSNLKKYDEVSEDVSLQSIFDRWLKSILDK